MDSSDLIWSQKYRAPSEKSRADSLWRTAVEVASIEKDPASAARRFFSAFENNQLLPGGRILANAGVTNVQRTLFNTFAMPPLVDGRARIHEALWRTARTMRAGGGIGINLSALRPAAKSAGQTEGPIAAMKLWDSMCGALLSGSPKRGAMMALLDCAHPDIRQFVSAKHRSGALTCFNVSVLVTDAFMKAVQEDAPWQLRFGDTVHDELPARELWGQIVQSSFSTAEPGVVFIDRLNQRNNLGYCERIVATNSCAEQPLPANGCCPLASINIASLVSAPFTDHAQVDERKLESLAETGVRFLDDVVSVSFFPFPEQKAEAHAKRRIGLGLTGIGDALIMCRARYGSEEAVRLVERWTSCLRHASYRASALLARELGSFPAYDERFLSSPMVEGLDMSTRELIRRHGIRNGVLNSIAPAGSISLLADNVSSGIEPVFAHRLNRVVKLGDGEETVLRQSSVSVRRYQELHGETAELPDYFATAQSIRPMEHLKIMAAAQRNIDASISKTVNFPEDVQVNEMSELFTKAFEQGCNSLAVYRPSALRGSVLSPDNTSSARISM